MANNKSNTPLKYESENMEIENVELRFKIKDNKRSQGGNPVRVNVTFGPTIDSNGAMYFQFEEAEYPGNKVNARDVEILDGLGEHLIDLGITSFGLPSLSGE